MLKQLKGAMNAPRQIVKVVAQNTDGTVTAVSLSGRGVRAIGDGNVDQHIYVQDGRVLGPAPDLPHTEIEV